MSTTVGDNISHALFRLCRERNIDIDPRTPWGQQVSSIRKYAGQADWEIEQQRLRISRLEKQLRDNKLEPVK